MSTPGFVALIPARLASTRLPDKPLADIHGEPMVVHVARQAQASGARRVAVATESERIARAVEACGFAAVMTRADHVSGTDRLAEAVTQLGLADTEIVVNVQGDEPLIPPRLIADVARCLERSAGCEMATAAHPIETHADWMSPHVVKVVMNQAGEALYFSRAPIPFARDALAGFPVSTHTAAPPPGAILRHIGLYAYRAGFLRRYSTLPVSPLEQLESLEQLRVLWHGIRIAVLTTPDAPPAGVDTPADLERVRLQLNRP